MSTSQTATSVCCCKALHLGKRVPQSLCFLAVLQTCMPHAFPPLMC